MASPSQSLLTMQRGRGRRRPRGLVLAELLLALLVLGLAVGLALTLLGRFRQRIRLDRFASDLQTVAAAVERSHAASGRWPATAAEAGSHLPEGGWPAAPAFGGRYGWIPPGPAGRPGMITLTAFAPDLPLDLAPSALLALDRRIDDGDLAHGRLRTGFNGWPVYLVGDVK